MADTLMNLTELAGTLQDLANDLAQGYKDELAANGHYTTLGPDARRLINSIRTEVVVDGSAYEIRMTLMDYWKYLENGTRPHWPPPGVIAKWIEIKPVIPRPDSRGRIPTVKSLEYLIRRKISRVGTEGTHDLEKTKDAVITAYRDKLEAALQHDLYHYILKVSKS